MYKGNRITLDLETTNKEFGSALNEENKLLLCVWSANGGKLRQGVNDAFQRADFLVAHNAKFELGWLRRKHFDLHNIIVWDTMIAEYVIHGNERVPLGLGPVAERYGFPGKEPYVDLCMKGGVCPSELPRSMLLQRCAYDVRVTDEIFKKQYKIIKQQGKLAVMQTRCMLTPALADIEANGMHLDSARVDELYFDVLEKHEACTERLNELTGGINYNSGKQMGEYLYDVLGIPEKTNRRGEPERTAKGARKTDAATIQSLKGKNKKQKEVLALLKERAYLDAQLTKALKKFKECCDNKEFLYANFNQTITRTHRLSSSGTKYKIQFQNMAREHKPLFMPRNEGWLMCEADGAQLEFRVAAYLGQDKQATEDIRNGVDVHEFTAKTITDAGQDTDRQTAKAHTFKPLYGGMSGTKAEVAYYEAFKRKYSGVANAQQAWIDEVLRHKKLRTETGLEFFWPDTKMTRTGFVTNTQSICNYPVQSLATADIIPIALVALWKEIKQRNLRSFIVNTVHDSVIMEVHPDEVDVIKQISIDCFTHFVYNYLSEVYDINFNVPLGVGIKFGQHWSEGEEMKLNVEPQ